MSLHGGNTNFHCGSQEMKLAVIGALWFWAASLPQPAEVARVRTYTEGPVFDRDGNLFFTHNEGI